MNMTLKNSIVETPADGNVSLSLSISFNLFQNCVRTLEFHQTGPGEEMIFEMGSGSVLLAIMVIP